MHINKLLLLLLLLLLACLFNLPFREQTRLVNVSMKIEGLTEQLVEQKARTAIIQRKKQRLLHVCYGLLFFL